MKSCWKSSVVFLALLVLALLAYWPGLKGGFLFDDFYNLEPLGADGGITDWTTLKSFVLHGVSSSLGRPLSLLTILLDDNAWPSIASGFKATNLKIHLLCGLLLCWVCLKLLREYRFPERSAQWMAVFASACWLLHPLMVSTTLYVIQRMAMLSTLFVFAAILGYLHGRSLLPERRRAAYLWMTASLGLGTILGVLAKENGALLPLLIFVIEFCLPDSPCRPDRRWRLVFLALPSLGLIGYLAGQIDFSAHPWPVRSFNQPERLWSEARILWEYLGQLAIPRIEGRGLFQDGYHVSRGWLTPWTTLPAVLGLIAMFSSALFLRRRWPLVSLAILFFFAGHLLESSVIGLELYFEHRNYLSAAFLFLPLGWGLSLLATKIERGLVFAIAALILALFAFFTWQRASLWGDTEKLQLYWAYENLDSPRAHNHISGYLIRTGRFEEADRHSQEAIARLPDSTLLNLGWLLQRIYAHQASEADFELAGKRLAKQPADPQAVMAMRSIVDKVVMPGIADSYRDWTLHLLDAAQVNSKYGNFNEFRRLVPYLKGRVYLAKLDSDKACKKFQVAMTLYDDADSGLAMVAEAASYRFYACAHILLKQAEGVLEKQEDGRLKRSRAQYGKEIVGLRKTMDEDEAEWHEMQQKRLKAGSVRGRSATRP